MKDSRRIVIYGASIYMLAIESGLAGVLEGDVVRIAPDLLDTAERISLLEPHVVITELNKENSGLALEILCQGIPIIVLDESRCSIKVLVREHLPKAEIGELTHVIEKINQDQDFFSCR